MIVVSYGSHLLYNLMHVWKVLCILAYLAILQGITRLPTWVHRIITELLILEKSRKHINTEPIHATIEPEAQNIVHRFPYIRIAPVQIGLFHIECVHVILPRLLIKLPGRATEITKPTIRWTTTRRRVSPDVPITFFVRTTRTR